jgi:hypothetical protein
MDTPKYATLHNLKNLPAGSIVKVIDCDGQIWEQTLWRTDDQVAYLSSADRYQRMLDGDPEVRPVGFLLSDLVPGRE